MNKCFYFIFIFRVVCSLQLDMVVTEEVLEEAFNCYGEPTDCAVKRHRVTQVMEISFSVRGYGCELDF